MTLPDRLHLKTITATGSHIILVARDEDRKRWVVNVQGFAPYFFVPRSDAKILRKRGLDHAETDLVGLDGEPIYQVFVDTPMQVGKRRKGFSKTYEADVPYTRRFLIDTGIKDGFRVKRGDVMGDVILCDWTDVEPLDYRNEDRQFLYDIETNKPDGSDTWSPAIFAKGAVSAITFHDTEDNGTIHSYIWHPVRGQRGHPRTETRNRYSRGVGRHVDWHIHWFGTEREMFEAYIADYKERQPDALSAWNGHFGHKKQKNTGGYDIPYLVNRLPRVGLSASNWSPVGSAFAGYKNFGKTAKAGKWQCYVDGIQLIDSMTTMQVKDGGMMPSIPDSSLKGIVYKTTKDDPEGPIQLDKGVRGNIDWFWEHETDTFLDYSFDDVDAQVVLENRHGYTDWIRSLQQFVGAEDANRLFTPMSLISTMTHRLAREDGTAVPTANQDHDEDESKGDDHTTGGFVMEPKQKGLQVVMAILDLDAMYVNIIRSCNLSRETWVEDPSDEEKESLICVPETDYGPQYFLQPDEKVGLSAKVSSFFKKGREVYDEQIKQATDADVIAALKKARDPAKQLTLAVWGNTLSPHFQLYRQEVGASILGMGRYIITGVDRFLQTHGYVVQYSDTDSVFIALKTPYDPDNPTPEQKKAIIEEGEHLCALINEWFSEMATGLNIKQHTFNIGFENLLSPFVQGSQKKMYAGIPIWSEGSWQNAEKVKPIIKGVPGIKTDAAPITQRVTNTVIRMMLRRADPFDILQYVYDLYETALDGDVDLDDVVQAKTLSSLPDPTKDAGDQNPKLHYITKAAWVGMREYGFEYEVGSRVRLVKLVGDKVTVAIPEGMDVPDDLPVDWAAHIDGTILDAVRGVMDWIDMADQMESIRVGSTPTRTNALP